MINRSFPVCSQEHQQGHQQTNGFHFKVRAPATVQLGENAATTIKAITESKGLSKATPNRTPLELDQPNTKV